MATKLWCRDIVTSFTDIYSDLAVPLFDPPTPGHPWDCGSTGYGFQDGGLATTQGSGSFNTRSKTSVAGPTSGINGLIWCLSAPLTADVTISGTVTFNVWASESSMNANATVIARVYRIQPDGTWSLIVTDSSFGTEVGTSRAAKNWTATPTSTAMKKGDRILLGWGWDDATGVTMASGFTLTISWEGSAGTDGDTWVQFTEALTFDETGRTGPPGTNDPAGSKYFFRDTASDLTATADDERAMSKTRGSSPTASPATAVGNTVAGPVAGGTQWTKTAGGTAVTWYTPQLRAFTLSGKARVVLWAIASVANTLTENMVIEIAVCDADGSNATVWVKTWGQFDRSGLTTTMSAPGNWFNVCGRDIAVTDGQRIRIRIYHDEHYNNTSGNPTASGRTVTFQYDGDTNNSSGDSYIIFAETITEYVGAIPPDLLSARHTPRRRLHQRI